MAIVTNNNNLGTAIGSLYTGNGIETKFFTVTVKDSSNTVMDLEHTTMQVATSTKTVQKTEFYKNVK